MNQLHCNAHYNAQSPPVSPRSKAILDLVGKDVLVKTNKGTYDKERLISYDPKTKSGKFFDKISYLGNFKVGSYVQEITPFNTEDESKLKPVSPPPPSIPEPSPLPPTSPTMPASASPATKKVFPSKDILSEQLHELFNNNDIVPYLGEKLIPELVSFFSEKTKNKDGIDLGYEFAFSNAFSGLPSIGLSGAEMTLNKVKIHFNGKELSFKNAILELLGQYACD